MKTISFLIPCYRSEATLSAVVREIKDTMAEMAQYDFEIVLINDCSPDNTFDVIKRLCAEDPRITGISLSKNFGQHAALMAGMRRAQGDIVVCLDDDGQTPANEVGKLLAEIEAGRDAVYASYANKQHSLFRRFGSRLNNSMASALLGKPPRLQVTSYFAVTRFVVDEILRYTNPYPYVIGLVLRATNNISNVEVPHKSRETGKSGYTFTKLVSLWINGFTTFSVKPLRIATVIGTLFAAAGFIFSIVTMIRKLINNSIQAGWPSMICTIMIASGLPMLMIGLVGEYIGRVYISINQSPQYVVREVVGEKEAPSDQ